MSLQTIEQEWNFLTSTIFLTNFASADDIVYRSDRVPRGFKGIIKEINVAFTTTGGGIYFAKQTTGGTIIRASLNFTSTSSGQTAIIVDEGERLIIALSATGAGVIEINADGIIRQKANPALIFAAPTVGFEEEGFS